MTPRGRRSRQKIKFELLVNEFNESLNTSEMRQGGYGQNSTPSSQQVNGSFNKQLNQFVLKQKISSALSARPGKVNVFQFGGAQRTNQINYLESSDKDSSSMAYDPEVETEFNRLRDEGHFSRDNGVGGVLQGKGALRYEFKSTNYRGAYQEQEDETLFFEDFMRMSKRRRSKSLDQIHTIVLSDKIFTREQRAMSPVDAVSEEENKQKVGGAEVLYQEKIILEEEPKIEEIQQKDATNIPDDIDVEQIRKMYHSRSHSGMINTNNIFFDEQDEDDLLSHGLEDLESEVKMAQENSDVNFDESPDKENEK